MRGQQGFDDRPQLVIDQLLHAQDEANASPGVKKSALKKPFHIVQLDLGATDPLARGATAWLRLHGVHVLNVAGPRESKRPGIYAATFAFLEALDQGYDPPRVAASPNS